jgi:Zn-dependent peptidase ImmA (M78 family)
MESGPMSDRLKIECKWLGRQTGNAIDRSFYADIGLAVGDEWLTQLEDIEASTVRNHLRGCAHQLATWFAANWWRLRWEPAIPAWWKDSGWRTSHSVAAAGNGYVWPNVIFVSDGDFLSIASLPRPKRSEFELIRYLNRILTRVSAAEFETSVDSFIEGILSRSQSRQVESKSLQLLWTEILAERNDAQLTERRKLEAMLGFDPDDAPEVLLQQVLEDENELGRSAVTEVAAEARQEAPRVLELIRSLAVSKRKANTGGVRVSLPSFKIPPKFDSGLHRPWEKGTELARIARSRWGLDDKPITDKQLANLVEAAPALFTYASSAVTRIPIGVKKGSNGTFDVYLESLQPTNRRFTMCRMIGDHLYFTNSEKVLPATHAKTARQKFQRAFAQEFLCPIDALRGQLKASPPDEDDISEAAKHFQVSPLLVRTTLVNKGALDREALGWDD